MRVIQMTPEQLFKELNCIIWMARILSLSKGRAMTR